MTIRIVPIKNRDYSRAVYVPMYGYFVVIFILFLEKREIFR